MARTRLVVVGLMAVALLSVGALAAKDSKNSKNSKTDDEGGADDEVAELSKKASKDCYKANPGCLGECVATDDDETGWACVAPEGSDDEFELCGPSKHGKGEFAEWVDGDAACTCAEGWVTSEKVIEHAEKTGKMPPASKLCTVECENPECLNGDGPLDCVCLDGEDDDEKTSSKAEKKDKHNKDDEDDEVPVDVKATKPAAVVAPAAAAPVVAKPAAAPVVAAAAKPTA